MYEDMNLFGKDKFYFEVLEECDDEILNVRERYYIQKYNSYKNGYNSTKGGSSGEKIDYSFDKMTEMAKNGSSLLEIARECNLSTGYVSQFVNTSNVKIKNSSIKIGIDLYDVQFNFIRNFSSIKGTLKYIENIQRKNIDARNFYMRIKEACYSGGVFYGYRCRFSGDHFENSFIEKELRKIHKKEQNNKNNINDTLREKEENSKRNVELANTMYKLRNEGKSYDEIGRIFGKSGNSVRMYINRHSTLKEVKSNDFKVEALDVNGLKAFECDTFLDAAKIICNLNNLSSPKNISYNISKATESKKIYKGYYWLKIYNKRVEETI